jgi:hypothetical protein
MVMNRIKTQIEKMLIPEQAGFKPGKACTGQVLNICQHIEDGFEYKKKTGADSKEFCMLKISYIIIFIILLLLLFIQRHIAITLFLFSTYIY